jgi:valyl-tRNA synthetase
MAEIPKSYEPQGVEQQWYDRWVAAGCFKGKVDHTRESFAVMIPPPNVTGVLHMGHLLNNTLQDIMVRRARQEGKSALWLPGTDHAGIATQSRVEKELRQKEGKTRHDLGREKFIQVASDWRDKHGGIILGLCCERGEGVAQDAALALQWFRKAAAEGIEEAAATVALLTAASRRAS